MRTKMCARCEVVKPIDDFGLTPSRGKYYPHAYCKQCKSEREVLRRQKVKEIKEWLEIATVAKQAPCFSCPHRVGCREECAAFIGYLA